jgi:hypothetical protein
MVMHSDVFSLLFLKRFPWDACPLLPVGKTDGRLTGCWFVQPVWVLHLSGLAMEGST